MSQTFDYLIVGQGLAGSLLALELIKKGQKVLVVDNPAGQSASKVAAGIFNPITGKRFVKTWLADEIYPNLIPFYENLENEFGVKFLNNRPIFRPIETPKEQNQIIELCEKSEIVSFAKFENSPEELMKIIDCKFGGLSAKISGWLNVPIFLKTVKSHLQKSNQYISQYIDYKDIIVSKKAIIWQQFLFDKVIFCEGYSATVNPYLKWLPFNAVKGEVITINKNVNLKNHVLLKGIFVVPLGENNFKVGATYNWTDKTDEITEVGRLELENKFEKLLGSPFEIVAQNAGIRPATIDRRPFIGLHPAFENIGVFNGLGTKGVSLGPYFSAHFVDFLINNTQLMPEININRFSSLYLSSN